MNASSLGSRIDEVWRKIPVPHQVVWSRFKEAIEYDSALSGRRFDEVDLDDEPFAISSVYIELTEYTRSARRKSMPHACRKV